MPVGVETMHLRDDAIYTSRDLGVINKCCRFREVIAQMRVLNYSGFPDAAITILFSHQGF